MHKRRQASRGRATGFTLVELLIGLLLGLFLLGGVISIFIGSRQSFRVNENMARVQENARFSFEFLMREIREAGNIPCGARSMANVVAAPGFLPWWADWDAGTIVGYDGATAAPAQDTGTAPAERVAGTDAVTILRTISDESAFQLTSGHVPAANVFAVPTPAAFKQGDVISACDAKSAALFAVGPVSSATISYGVGAANCSTRLGYPTAACDASTPAKTFDDGAVLTKYDPAFWYIGNNPAGGKSLYRKQLTRDGGTPDDVAQEMVSGVSDMQIEYLVRDSATSNSLATSWISASHGTFTAGGQWSALNPKQVVAVRLTLTFRSEDNVGTDGQPLQRKFVAVASLRSRDLP